MSLSTVDSVLARYRRHLSSGRASLGEMFGGDVEVFASGAWVRTSSGRELLNCGGYGVFITGARHPRVLAEVRAQLDRNPVATRLLLEPQAALAAEALASVTPPGLDRVHFACSGTEAVEAALKLARANGRRHVVGTVNGYHGKTLGSLSVTGRPLFQNPFRPLLPDVSHVPYGSADALAQELAGHADGTVCVLLEPVQGEAGVIVPPAGYLREVAGLCRRHGAFLVLDEVQTGLGRLGAWWGADREGVVPDVLLAGKALGGGVVPVSALVATDEAFAPFDRDPFIHTSTFSGAPLGMAAVRGAIAAIQEDDLVTRADRLGRQLRDSLGSLLRDVFGDLAVLRGVGLLIGIELAVDGLAGELLLELMAGGVIANHSLNSDRVLRLTPPAVLDEREVGFLLDAFDGAARAVLR
ncbi:aspartate aminotransferase family protein [Actinophytocola sp.]|uniref:aspartate aminotransferase family protein n=1 Tax=Actinophytocola sp. TaxID=1872138 RepID=UPI00389997C6